MKKCHQNTKAPNYTKIKPLVPIKCFGGDLFYRLHDLILNATTFYSHYLTYIEIKISIN